MKLLPILIFICLQSHLVGQIEFEEVVPPFDFSLATIRKSFTGEYFVQASNDDESIFTSLNGNDWTKSSLPVDHELDDIQFFSDGTPLLRNQRSEALVRRNDDWHVMKVGSLSGNTEITVIKEDTLFTYHRGTFAYSLDKGETFIPLFTVSENIIAHTSYLFKFENFLVLYFTTGASNTLLVYSESGELVMNRHLDSSIADIMDNCNQVLFLSYNRYYLLREHGLILEAGNIHSIIPQYTSSSEVMAQNGNYYLRTGDTLYVTGGCNFEWNLLVTHDFINEYENVWITPEENVILFDKHDDVLIEGPINESQWQESFLNIGYPYLIDVDESMEDTQVLITASSLFRKSVSGPSWTKLDSSGSLEFEVQFSPNGDLYINRRSDILYSINHGNNFIRIDIPEDQLAIKDYSMHVLMDSIIFISGRYSHDYYYTLNNGKDWIFVNNTQFFSISDVPQVQLSGNYIIVAVFGSFNYGAFRININTNEVETADLEGLSNFDFYSFVIHEDGAVYIHATDFFADNSLLFRYRFGEGLENLGDFPELNFGSLLESSGKNLYSFGSYNYTVFDGENVNSFPIYGLPQNVAKRFTVSENGYLYVIVENNRLFRSVAPFYYNHTVSTDNTINLPGFDVYPNPSHSLLHLTLSDIQNSTINKYQILDNSGRIIQKSMFLNNNTLIVDHLPPGFYSLMLMQNDRIVGIEKFVKQ